MSKIKVNEVENRTGSTLTLGKSGTTVTLACGASQTGFGRAGSVNWCSTIYTNSPGTVTATSGKGFFLNTTSGAITINLPSSPSFGDIVAIKDYANTFDSNNVTVGRNGSKISGLCVDATLSTEGDSITLVFTDSTRGWLNVNTDVSVQGAQHIAATGGTVLTVGDFKTHVFTASGCFQVTNAGNAQGSNKIDYFVVGGGGGGGVVEGGGGGGAGGFRFSNEYGLAPALNTPITNPTGVTASAGTFPITVGAGGTAGSPPATDSVSGSPSTFSTITSAGGGRGGRWNSPSDRPGSDGGSGGGGSGRNTGGGGAYIAGSGNTPPVSPPQGNNGGNGEPGSSNPDRGGGGGGAGAAGTTVSGNPAGAGGDGTFIDNNFMGPTAPSYGEAGPVSNTRFFAGGGGGGKDGDSPNGGSAGDGGVGGGGDGGSGDASPRNASAGSANMGGGGGGQGTGTQPGSAAGGSGIVMLRYKFQN